MNAFNRHFTGLIALMVQAPVLVLLMF
jgi:hypothetical protein